MQMTVAEDLLRNTENFNMAFGNVMHNVINSSDSTYNRTIQRANVGMYFIIC